MRVVEGEWGWEKMARKKRDTEKTLSFVLFLRFSGGDDGKKRGGKEKKKKKWARKDEEQKENFQKFLQSVLQLLFPISFTARAV